MPIKNMGSATMRFNEGIIVSGSTTDSVQLYVSGNIGIDQYIYHNGDDNTHINFTDDQIVLKAGNVSMVKMEQKASAPHEVTINDGSNNIDFVVKGNGSANGNPGMKFDASNNRLGINGVGEPDEALHVWGDIKVDGSTPNLQFAESGTDRASISVNDSDNLVIHQQTLNKHIVFKVNDQGNTREGLRLDGAVPEVVVNQASDSLVDFRVESDNNTHMLFVDGSADKVGIRTASPISALDVAGKIAITTEVSTPSQPADGQGYLYSKSDGKLYWRSYDISEVDLTAAGGSGGGDALSLTALKTSNYTAANWEMVLVNLVGASGDVTVTLPAASSNAQIAVKIAGLAMGKEVIVDANSSETIDGLTTRIMNTDYESIHLISDGNNWWRIS